MASIFSLNGIWLQSISKAQGTCSQVIISLIFNRLEHGFSCAVRTDSRAGAQSFSVFDIDTDGDGYAKDIDAFPNISSQQYDTDLRMDTVMTRLAIKLIGIRTAGQLNHRPLWLYGP